MLPNCLAVVVAVNLSTRRTISKAVVVKSIWVRWEG